MNWRLYTLVGLVMIGAISGCATQPRSVGTSVAEEEPINGPSTVIAGAKVAEVRAIAMGSARSKGWTIVRATDQRLVLSRPVNPDAPQAVAAGLVANGTPPQIEVTSAFQQVPSGVQVTVGASLVTTDAQGAAQRADYTEAYAANLTRSLDALHAAWAENRQRVARALPSINTAGQSAAETAAELSANPNTATPSNAPQQSPLSDETAPTAWSAAQAAEPEPEYASAPPPDMTTPVVSAPAAAQPEPRIGSQSTGSAPAPVRSYAPPQPIATSTPMPPAENMMAMNRGPAARNEVGNAERYAAKRGCQVQAGRTTIFRRDPDAEYLRVYCAGDPAFVVKCNSGVCKVLE